MFKIGEVYIEKEFSHEENQSETFIYKVLDIKDKFIRIKYLYPLDLKETENFISIKFRDCEILSQEHKLEFL